jgi:hypothetical protein
VVWLCEMVAHTEESEVVSGLNVNSCLQTIII